MISAGFQALHYGKVALFYMYNFPWLVPERGFWYT